MTVLENIFFTCLMILLIVCVVFGCAIAIIFLVKLLIAIAKEDM